MEEYILNYLKLTGLDNWSDQYNTIDLEIVEKKSWHKILIYNS